MFNFIQNSRPIPATVYSTKPLTPSLKERLKIYNNSPPKQRQPPTSDEARRHPIKAYAIRLTSRGSSGGPSHSASPIKIGTRDNTPTSSVPKIEKLTRAGESNLLSQRKRHANLAAYMEAETQLDSEKMNDDFLRSFREKDAPDVKLVKSCLSLKDLMHPDSVLYKSDGMKTVVRVNRSPESPSNQRKGREGSNVVNLRKSATMLGIDKKDIIDTAEILRKSAIAETDKHSSTYIHLEEASPQDKSPSSNSTLTPNVLSVSQRDTLGISKVRPRTAFAIHHHTAPTPSKSQNQIQNQNQTVKLTLHRRESSDSPAIRKLESYVEQQQTFTQIPITDSVQAIVQVDDLYAQQETKKETPSVKELKIPIQESTNYNKYRIMKDNLKVESTGRIPRYQFSAKGRVITAKTPVNGSPERKLEAITAANTEIKIKPGSSHGQNRGNDEVLARGIMDIFKIERVIGQGSYATVRHVVERRTGVTFALKSYSKLRLCDAQRKESVKREVDILLTLEHSNIIKLHRTIDTPTQLHLVMEHGGGLSLMNYLKMKSGRKLEEEEAKVVFKQIVEGLQYLHQKNVAHRDMKLENILIDEESNVKIIDFGFSLVTPRTKPLNVCCGTPSYMAPELMARKNYYGHLVDVWALGIILYILVVGIFPFKAPTNHELYQKITTGQYQFPDFLSAEIKALIKKMLRMNPHERPSAKEILTDPWLTGQEEQQSSNLKDFLSSKILELKSLQQHQPL